MVSREPSSEEWQMMNPVSDAWESAGSRLFRHFVAQQRRRHGHHIAMIVPTLVPDYEWLRPVSVLTRFGWVLYYPIEAAYENDIPFFRGL